MKVNFGEAHEGFTLNPISLGTKIGKKLHRVPYVQDIKFPASEIPALKTQQKIITHRVSSDFEKFEKGDYVYCEEIDENYCFEIVDKKVISKIEDSQYFKQLTPQQVNVLQKYDKISVLTLQKTKYERPYKLSTIKEKYPEKVYLKLKSDRVHAWRAKTGLELIHKEPDSAEQTRVHNNWKLMSAAMKEESDKVCKLFFKMTNEEHYKYIIAHGENHES